MCPWSLLIVLNFSRRWSTNTSTPFSHRDNKWYYRDKSCLEGDTVDNITKHDGLHLVSRESKYIVDNASSCIDLVFTSQPYLEAAIKGLLKICSKFTEENPCRSVISIKLQSSFIEIALRHVWSPVNLLHIFRTTFSKNISGWLPLPYLVGLYILIAVIRFYILKFNLQIYFPPSSRSLALQRRQYRAYKKIN